jgi:hypothetical protein
LWNHGSKYSIEALTKPGLPTKTRVLGHKPSSLPWVDHNKARVFPKAVIDTGPSTQARSCLSFLSVAREGKGLARCVAFPTSRSSALSRWGRRLHIANVVSICLCVRHRHSWIAARAAAAWVGRGATAFYTSSVDA